MVNKKKLDFNSIVREFGFPTSVEKIRSTYRTECFDIESDMIEEAKEFEDELSEEIENQNANAEHTYGQDLGEPKYYDRFQNIFLKHSKIFDPELYLLQMSVLLERDLLTKEKIKAVLSSRGLKDASDKFIDDVFYKDKESLNSLLQILSGGGMNLKEGKRILQHITDMPDPNAWIPISKKRTIPSLIHTIRNRLVGSDVALVELTNSDINVTSSQVHIGNERFLDKKERENKKRYDEATIEIDLETEIRKLAPCDLKNVFRYDNIGTILSQNLYLTTEEIDANDKKIVVRDPVTNKPYFQDDILDAVKENLKYVDMDKLLLTILHVNLDEYGGNYSKFSYDEVVNLKKLSNSINGLLNKRDVTAKSGRVYDTVNFYKLSEIINWLDTSFIGKKYYSPDELNTLANEYMSGAKDVTTLTPHEFKNVLQFTDGEILTMLKQNPTILKYLIENDILSDDKAEDKENNQRLFNLIEKQDAISAEQLQILYDSGKLTKEYLLSLYIDTDKIDLESIHELKEKADESFFQNMVNENELINLYLAKNEVDKKDKFDKYRKLYKELEIDGKTQEEKNEISENILDKSIELLKEESIMELYSLGLISIDTLIDYTGGYSLKTLYLSNELKPMDAKRLFYRGIITEEMLKDIMLDKNIDEGRKITLLYSTFPDVEDTEIMRNLEVCLREVSEDSKFNSSADSNITPKESATKTSPEDELKKLKKAYEPRAKYRLLSAIDKEYQFKYNIKDGMGIFYFPNRDEYVIEKLYAKGNVPATGVATYILSKNLYEENQERFMQDGVINISELYALKKSNPKGIKRFVHTGWANAIVKYYELDDERKYNKRQIMQIKDLAKQVEESKKEIER